MKKGLLITLHIMEVFLVLGISVLLIALLSEGWAGVFLILYFIGRSTAEYLLRPRCPRCGTIMKLKRIEDKFSYNLSDKVRISFIQFKGIPKTETRTYHCKSCNRAVIRKELH